MASKDRDGLHKRAGSQYWWASYIDETGRRVRRSTQTVDKRKAGQALTAWKHAAWQARQLGVEPPKTYDTLMLAWIERGSGAGPCKKYGASLRRLTEAFTGQTLDAIDGPAVRRYVAAQTANGIGAANLHKDLDLLSGAYRHAATFEGWRVVNPAKGCRPALPASRVRWISRTEAEQLISVAESSRSEHMADFIKLALHTGMRAGEMVGLTWDRVDLNRKLIVLEPQHTKSRKRRTVPINATAYQALIGRARWRATYCPDSPLVFCQQNGQGIGEPNKPFKTICQRAGITNLHIHDLRHTCAAWLVSAGVPLPEVRDLLGHSSVTMTEMYAHLAPERVREAVAQLDKSQTGHSRQREG